MAKNTFDYVPNGKQLKENRFIFGKYDTDRDTDNMYIQRTLTRKNVNINLIILKQLK